MKREKISFFVFSALCFFLSTKITAANDAPKPLDDWTFIFQLENDLVSGSDRHYTNGIRLSLLSPAKLNSDDTGKSERWGLSLGQDMYTPQDRYTRTLITDDRPYGAWLYAAVSRHTITDTGNGSKTLESMELDLGVVGPAAQGEEVQDFVHEARLIDTFEGWDNQIKNEPALALLYENKWRLGAPAEVFGFGQFDAIPHMGLSLGNVSTHAGTGGVIRWGHNLPENFGPPSLIHGGTPFQNWDNDSEQINFSAFLFATAAGKYVARNIFLDGNTFRDSHSVSRRPWVADFSVGASLLIGPINLSYSTALRTREFDGQDHNNRFGSLTISMQNPF